MSIDEPSWFLVKLCRYLADHPDVPRDQLNRDLGTPPTRMSLGQASRRAAHEGRSGDMTHRSKGQDVVRRGLRELEEHGVLERSDNRVRVLIDPQRLRSLADRWAQRKGEIG